jgi:hypothetical protein
LVDPSRTWDFHAPVPAVTFEHDRFLAVTLYFDAPQVFLCIGNYCECPLDFIRVVL